MKILSLFLSIICLFATNAFAEQATGLCKDGTAYTGASKRGACRGHKGIQEWYADKAAPAAASAPAATAAPAASAAGPVTGLCKDGTQTSGTSKRGACRGHKGIQEWYADEQAPAQTPAPTAAAPVVASGAATGLCKDGTETTGASKRGACRGHKGVQEWYADKQAQTPAAVAPAATTTAPAAAAAPAVASGAATGLCKDGTETTGASKRGACRGHKGIQEWYADKQAPAQTPAVAPAAAAPAAPAAAPATAAPAAAPAQATKPASAPVAQTPPPAGSGQVWVNTRSKIYHCEGSKFFGKTKEGGFMSEADAQAQGFVANRKKVCH